MYDLENDTLPEEALDTEVIEDEELLPHEDGWVCSTDEAADWAIRKIQFARREKERWENFYQDQLARITTKYDTTIAFFESKLRGFLRMRSDEGMTTSTKTILAKYKLPTGSLELKAGTYEYIKDDEALVDWLKKAKMEEFVQTIYKPDWAGLKKTVTVMPDGKIAIDETGEIVDGVTAQKKPDSFVVK